MKRALNPWRVAVLAAILSVLSGAAIVVSMPVSKTKPVASKPLPPQDAENSEEWVLEYPPTMPDMERCRRISLSEARSLLTEKKVIGIYQPHEGEVGMALSNTESVCFTQPYLDWVVHQIARNGQNGKVTIMME